MRSPNSSKTRWRGSDVFRRNDERTIYNLIYQDGAFGKAFVKRFNITGVIRDKEYLLTNNTKGSKILYLSVNPNGEAEVVTLYFKPRPKLRKLTLDLDFANIIIKGKSSKGNIASNNLVRKVVKKGEGVSTLSARKIWFDQSINKLNAEERGKLLGSFSGAEKILSIYSDGNYRLTGYDLSTHFDNNLLVIEKYNPNKPYTAIYLDKDKTTYFIKRFIIEETDKIINFLEEQDGASLVYILNDWKPVIEIEQKDEKKDKQLDNEVIDISEFIDIMRYKAKGKRLSKFKITKINILEPIEYIEEEIEEEESQEEEISLDNNQKLISDDFIQGELF